MPEPSSGRIGGDDLFDGLLSHRGIHISLTVRLSTLSRAANGQKSS